MSTAASTEEIVKDPPDPEWKKVESTSPDTKCLLCQCGAEDPAILGDLYQIDQIICHYFCLLLSSSLVQNGSDNEGILGFLPKDILKECRRGLRLKCSYCKKKGATIGCTIKKCRQVFHLPCGLKNGSMHQFFEQFLSFCSTHRPHQKVAAIALPNEDEDAKTCPICYEVDGNMVSNDALWAPCCRKRWFHRLCLQRQALAQGYFFKCPMCNNKDDFNSEMKSFGIYIPEMDAAWEREPLAFQDLLHTHKMCDARKCQCPDGRNIAQNTGSWRLLRCNSCGSQGTHIKCSGLKMAVSSNSWRCSLCAKIMNKGKESRTKDDLDTRPWTSSPEVMQSTSSTPSTSSGSSSNNSSQRRKPVDVLCEQDRKRRKSSSDSTKLGTNNPANDIRQQVKEFLKEFIKEQSQEQLKDDSGEESEGDSKSVKDQSSDDEDEIVVVDDSESDIEVVEIEKKPTSLRMYPISSELLTNDGKTIKVHRVSAEGPAVPLEIGSLGAVNMRPVAESTSSPSKSWYNAPGPKSRKVDKPDVSHPSTSKTLAQELTQNVPGVSASEVSCPNNSTSSTLGIKIGDVRHSNEFFSATSKEQGGSGPETSMQASQALLDYLKKLMCPVQNIYLVPVQTQDGTTAVQPMIPVNSLSLIQQQQLVQKMQAERLSAAKEKSRASPDVVTLE